MTDFKDLASKLIEVSVALIEHSKASSAPTEAGTATPLATPAQEKPPWTKQEIREAMGFAPDDPNVKVVIHPFDGTGDGFTATVTPKPEPMGSTDSEQDDTANFTPPWQVDIDAVLHEVSEEITRASEKHPPMNSAHEGYAILKEEVDELWDLIKIDHGYTARARKEAIQVAAMALRYVLDLGPKEGGGQF